ncbi:MAG: hypothetical protein HDR24_09580 [Lachnospiraceae bacterium]|nr:hypothetical protein [Lachnospiraceae bacterium]
MGQMENGVPEDKGEEKIMPANEMQENSSKSRSKWLIIFVVILAVLLIIGIVAGAIIYSSFPRGYENYTVQKEQYFVEYSEEYDYWDVITVEYPRLEGIDEEVQGQLNQLMYDTAMDRVNYWHLEPSDEVKDFQEEYFSIFASDVNCDITYHSQYLLSLDYNEYYAAGHPVWMTNGTKRALTVDLLTGQSYSLGDILEINRDFMKVWDKSLSDELDMEYADDEDLDLLLSWFLQTDEEINEDFICRPFFYITDEKEFVIGVSLDPVLEYAYTYEPVNRSYYTQLSAEELEVFKKQSDFWDKFEKSETTGEVLSCIDKKDNIWLGEDAGVWDYEY